MMATELRGRTIAVKIRLEMVMKMIRTVVEFLNIQAVIFISEPGSIETFSVSYPSKERRWWRHWGLIQHRRSQKRRCPRSVGEPPRSLRSQSVLFDEFWFLKSKWCRKKLVQTNRTTQLRSTRACSNPMEGRLMVTVSNKGGNHLILAETAGFQLGEDCRGHTWRTELITTSDNCDCKRHKKYPNSTKLSEKNIKTIAHIFVHVRHSMPDR